jgi:hypothetical protein
MQMEDEEDAQIEELEEEFDEEQESAPSPNIRLVFLNKLKSNKKYSSIIRRLDYV